MFRPRIAISSVRLFTAGVLVAAPARTTSAFVSYPASRDALHIQQIVKERCSSLALVFLGLALAYRQELGYSCCVETMLV